MIPIETVPLPDIVRDLMEYTEDAVLHSVSVFQNCILLVKILPFVRKEKAALALAFFPLYAYQK